MPDANSHSSPLLSTLERVQACAGFDRRSTRKSWLELLGLTSKDYASVADGTRALSEKAILQVADHFQIPPESLISGEIDFRRISVLWGRGDKDLSEAYSTAAFGKRRTTITSFDYIESRFGWRTRSELLARFNLNEAVMTDFTAPINMQFMTDVTLHLKQKHGLRPPDFFRMGAHSAIGNRYTMVGETLSSSRSLPEAYEVLMGGLIRLFEQNTRYSLTDLDLSGCTVEVSSY